MANIELVVKIDEEYIKQIDRLRFLTDVIEDRSLQINVINAIKNGIPLPKGHGKLKDVDAIKKNQFILGTSNYCEYRVVKTKDIDEADTIIEADTQNKEKEDITPYITGATLLSVEEAKNLDKEILKADKDWWLRSPGYLDYRAALVGGDDGRVLGSHVEIAFGVRPALIISDLKSSNLKIGDTLSFGDHSFTIISDCYALCDDIIGKCAFRKDSKAENSNEYEASDIKRYVETWFEEVKEQSLEGRDSEEERER